MKLDVQGFEMSVLKGAEASLNNIRGLQVELSIEKLYKDGLLYQDMISYIESKGFELYSLENGFSDPKTGKLLQFDGVFFR